MTNKTQHTTEIDTMSNPTTTQRKAIAALAGLALVAALSGCSSGIPTNFGVAQPLSTLKVTGNVHGGQNPIKFSTIHLYTVGTSGVGSASSDITNTTVMSDANGNFTLTGTYSCTNATDVYIVSQGGDPGSGVNSAITLAAVLGPCSALSSSTFTQVNEVTTVAAAYALAPFANGYANVGANFGSTPAVVPTGLANAFGNAALLADTTRGTAGNAGNATGVTVPVAEMNTLANILASCVNTTGSGSTACTALFGATGASETFGAALAIAKNPGSVAITALYTYSGSTAPFQPSMVSSSAPNDFTVAVTMAGSGVLATPYGIAIDAVGNAWVTNESGSSVTEFGANGSQLANPTATGLIGAQGIAVDVLGNVWVANTAGNSVVKFTLTAGAVTGSNSFTAGGIAGPSAIALDDDTDVFVANFNGNSVTGLNASGSPLSGSPFTGSGNITNPSGIALDNAAMVYVTSGTNGSPIVQLTNSGAFAAILSDFATQGPTAIAASNQSNKIVATGYTTGTATAGALLELLNNGTASNVSPVATVFSTPAGIATDNKFFWVANGSASGGLSQWLYGASAAVSPAAGFGSLNAPVGVAVDNSGSVWTANSGSNTVTKFIGLAAPVVTPLAANSDPS
jgi:hypothetical protein